MRRQVLRITNNNNISTLAVNVATPSETRKGMVKLFPLVFFDAGYRIGATPSELNFAIELLNNGLMYELDLYKMYSNVEVTQEI